MIHKHPYQSAYIFHKKVYQSVYILLIRVLSPGEYMNKKKKAEARKKLAGMILGYPFG